MQNLKLKKIVRLICALSLLTLYLSSPIFAGINFTFSEVFSSSWGESDTNVGFNQSFDKNYGPAAYYISPSNKIYILDSINRKFKIFNETEGILTALPIILPTETFINFIIDETENCAYVLNIDNEIFQYSILTGGFIDKIPVSSKIQLVNGLILKGSKLYVSTSSQWMYLIKDGIYEIPVENQTSNFIQGIFDNYSNNIFKTICENRENGIIHRLSEQGLILNETNISFDAKNLMTFIFLAESIENTYYAVVEEDAGDNNVIRNIKVYSQEGNGLFSVNVPPVYYSYIEKPFQVDSEGNIYHLISKPNGITLAKLTRINSTGRRARTYLDYPADYTDNPVHFNDNLLKEPEGFDEDGSQSGEVESGRSIQRPTTSASNVTRSEALVIAEAYRDLQWTAISSNISDGEVPVGGHIIKTPAWITLGAKTSVPYKWGGFTSIETYLTQVAAGKYAGSCYTSDVSWGDDYCVGVDCSGFVSRCWRRSSKEGTSTLPNISAQLSGFDNMQTGDIVNYAGSHVRMFHKKEENGTYSFIEAMGTYWRVMSRNYSASDLSNYLPRRYNNIIEIDSPVLIGIFNTTGSDVILKWKKPSSSNVQNIKIYIGTDGESYNLKANVSASSGQTTLTGLTGGTLYYINATYADSVGREGLYSKDYAIRPNATSAQSEIILVDDELRYGTHNIVKYYAPAMANAGYYFDVCSVEAVLNDTVNLGDYWAAVWFTGRGSSTGGDASLNSSEQSKIQTYLQAGGNLFISGQEIGYDLESKGLGVSFLNNYLKADYKADDAGNDVSLTGITGKILAGVSFDLDEDNGLVNDGGAYDARYPDVIYAYSGGDTICQYSSNNGGGVSFKGMFPSGSQEGAIVYFSFPFETIKTSSSRNTVMSKVLGFFPVPETDTSPKITIASSYNGIPDNPFQILLTASDNKDTSSGLTWSLSGASVVLFNSINAVESSNDYIQVNPASLAGTDTLIVFVTDSDGMSDSKEITIVLQLIAIPDTPVIYYVKNNPSDTSIDIGWQNDAKAYKYEIYSCTDNFSYIAKYTVYSPATTLNIKDVLNNTKYYFKIKSYNSVDTPSPAFSMTLGLKTVSGSPDIVLVEDDFSVFPHDYIAKFVGSLSDGANKSFDCVLSTGITDGSVNLNDYRTVVWSCGNDSTVYGISLSSVEIDKIKEFLDNGGNLFISGNEIGAELKILDSEFYGKYLKSSFGYTDSYRFDLSCLSTGILNGISDFAIYTDDASSVAGSAAYMIKTPDRLNISSINSLYGGKVTLKYPSTGWAAGADFTGGFGIEGDDEYPYLETSKNLSKLVMFTFAFECINDINARKNIMAKIINYFDSSSVAGRIDLEDNDNDTGVAVYLVNNTLNDTSASYTDESGRFRFDFVSPGQYYVSLKKQGYNDFTSNLFNLTSKIDTLIIAALTSNSVDSIPDSADSVYQYIADTLTPASVFELNTNNVDTLILEIPDFENNKWTAEIDLPASGCSVVVSGISESFMNSTDTSAIGKYAYGINRGLSIEVFNSLGANISNSLDDSPVIEFDYTNVGITTAEHRLRFFWLNPADSKWYEAGGNINAPGYGQNYELNTASKILKLKVKHLSHWWLGSLTDTLTVIKNSDINAETAAKNAANVPVISFYVMGDTYMDNGDTLVTVSVGNKGNMNYSHINAVKLWLDSDTNFTYNSGDEYIANLYWNGGKSLWENNAVNYYLMSGANFVLTVDVADSAVQGETFQAYIPVQGIDSEDEYPAPETELINSYSFSAVSPSIDVIISCVLFDTGTGYDGNQSDVIPGGILLFTIEFTDSSSAYAENIIINHYLPENIEYINGSIELDTDISDGSGYATKTDSADGDEIDYNVSLANNITANIGRMYPAQTGRLRFKVYVP
ncbi:MAG TPA: carboxypeptidase-like regulatory domain-containing protein [bacterium]|nr:carboxypeptidase-like regulatory domain-containing protein [bacterium]